MIFSRLSGPFRSVPARQINLENGDRWLVDALAVREWSAVGVLAAMVEFRSALRNFAIPRRIRTAGQTADRFPAPPLCVWTAFEVLFSTPPIRPPIFHGMVGISSIQKHCRGLALRVRSDADDCIVKPAAANRHDLVQMSFPIWMSKTKPSPTWAFTIELNTRQWIQSMEM
jgi:hypothetical protein